MFNFLMKRPYARNIPLLYAYSTLIKRVALPILVVYYLSKGLSYTEIGIIAAAQAITTILLEVPGGIFADVHGRRISMVVSSFFSMATMTLLYFGNGFIEFFIASALYGVSFALDSGTRESLLFDSLHAEGRQTLFSKYYGRMLSFAYALNAFFLLTIPALAEFNLRLPILINVGFYALSLAVGLAIKEPKLTRHEHEHSYKKTLASAVGTLKGSRQAQFMVGFITITFAFLYVLMEFKQAFMKEVGLPLVYFGLVYFLMRVLFSAASALTHKIQTKLAGSTLVFIGIIAVTGGLLGLGFAGMLLGIAFILWLALIEGVLRIFTVAELNSIIPRKARTTVLSIKSLFINILQAGLAVLLGFLADAFGLRVMFVITAVIFTVLSLILVFVFRKEVMRLVIKKDEGHVLE